jgi:hypothetical protein
VEPRSGAYAERALGRALGSALRGQPIRLLTSEDFVVFKVRALIESELATLARELPDHEVAERRNRVLA